MKKLSFFLIESIPMIAPKTMIIITSSSVKKTFKRECNVMRWKFILIVLRHIEEGIRSLARRKVLENNRRQKSVGNFKNIRMSFNLLENIKKTILLLKVLKN